MKRLKILGWVLSIVVFFSACSENEEPADVSILSVEATSPDAMEPNVKGEFTIKLTPSVGTSATEITYSIGGTATNGVDYEELSGVVTILPGRSSVAISVNIISDEVIEGSETVTLTLTGTNNPAIAIGPPSMATVTISEEGEDVVLLPGETPGYMVNPNATDETVAMFYNLKTISATNFLIGQQDAFNSFYNNARGESDVKKTTGSDPGLLGSDYMFITDDNNDGTPTNWFFQQEQQIKGDAIEAYNKGMVNIFSWHIREPYEGDHFYTSEMTEFQKQNAFKSILPGGENHDYYKEKLDKVAEVAQTMVGDDGKLVPIIFRPFHEFDGNWFWWGAAYCTPEEFIENWQFTVDYLVDEKGVTNMLFAFSPDKNFNSETEYLARYPGDAYVDVLGFDDYGDYNNGEAGAAAANAKLQIISSLAKKRVKIAALTETCRFVKPGEIPFVPEFYSNNLYSSLTDNNVDVAFMMFWVNSQSEYCTPPPSQTSAAEDFILFANKPKSLLADDLPDMYTMP